MSTTTNLSTLKINYLTDAQYQTALDGGQINENEIYLTPSSDGGGTSVPTANSTAKFDSSAHMNSTDMTSSEVTSFISGLDGQGTSLADYVIEQGASGSWTYRKWSSGIYECWMRTANSSAVTIYFPITFIELPRIIATSGSSSSASTYGADDVYTRGTTTSKTDITFQSNVTNTNIWADIYVIGKWK